MAWLVGLPITEPSDRMTNFLNHLDDIRQGAGHDPFAIERGPTIFASAVIVAETADEVQEIIRIWEEWLKEYYPHIQSGEPTVAELTGDWKPHPRGMIITADCAYADRIVAHQGKAPRDISADCVIALTDASGKRKHIIFYPFGRDLFRQSFLAACQGAREVVVRWVDPDLPKLFPDLFPLLAAR